MKIKSRVAANNIGLPIIIFAFVGELSLEIIDTIVEIIIRRAGI